MPCFFELTWSGQQPNVEYWHPQPAEKLVPAAGVTSSGQQPNSVALQQESGRI